MRSPKPYRSTVAKGDTINAIKDALNSVNIGEQGNGFVILKDKLPLDKKAISILKKNGLDGIWYRNGRPDFTPVSLFNVQIQNMSVDRTKSGGNFDQTRNAISETIIRHNGNINSLIESGIVSEYASANTKKTVFKFLKNDDIKNVLNSKSSYSQKVKDLNSLIKSNFQDSSTNKYTIHEVNTKDVQLVPYEINARYNHDGGVSDCGKNESITNQCIKK